MIRYKFKTNAGYQLLYQQHFKIQLSINFSRKQVKKKLHSKICVSFTTTTKPHWLLYLKMSLQNVSYPELENKAYYLNDSNGKNKRIPKSHLWTSICASGTQHLGSICESEEKGKKEKKEWKEENGSLSLNIKQGMIFFNQGNFKEGKYLWERSSQLDFTAALSKTDTKSSHKTLSAKTRCC